MPGITVAFERSMTLAPDGRGRLGPAYVTRSPRTITTWLESIMPERASNRRPARMATIWALGARYLPAVCACAGEVANPAIAAMAATSTEWRFRCNFMRSLPGSQYDRALCRHSIGNSRQRSNTEDTAC